MPLDGIPFTNNGFYTHFCLLKQAMEGPWTHGIPPTLPLLLVSGENDPIGQFGPGVRHVAQPLAHAGFAPVQLVLYPGLRHDILQEASKQASSRGTTRWPLS